MNSTKSTGRTSTRISRIKNRHSKNRTRRKAGVTVAEIRKSAKMTRNHLRKRDQNVKEIERFG